MVSAASNQHRLPKVEIFWNGCGAGKERRLYIFVPPFCAAQNLIRLAWGGGDKLFWGTHAHSPKAHAHHHRLILSPTDFEIQ